MKVCSQCKFLFTSTVMLVLTPTSTDDNTDYFEHFPAVRSDTLIPPSTFIQPWHDRQAWLFCQYSPHASLRGELITCMPVTFEVTGRISRRECFLTMRGDEDTDGDYSQKAPMATCWLKAPRANAKRAEWDRMMLWLYQIAGTGSTSLRSWEFIVLRRGERSAEVQVVWGLAAANTVRV